MAEDTRKGRKTNRKRVVKEVDQAHQAAGVEKPEKPKKQKRASRALTGSDKWLRKIRNTLKCSEAKKLFDAIGEPDKSALELSYKLLATHAFLIMSSSTLLEDKIGTPAEESARAYVEDCRKNARIIKDLAAAMVKVRGQYASENLDNNPDVIELIGGENFRQQLTTTTAPAQENVH